MEYRGRYALEPADRPQADIEIQPLAHRDVDGADAAADRRGQRPLDGDQTLPASVQRLFRQPGVRRIDGVSLLARINLHPRNLPALPVCGLHGGVPCGHRSAGDIRPRSVTFDERDDRPIRNPQLPIRTHRNLFAKRRELNLLVGHIVSSIFPVASSAGRGSHRGSPRFPSTASPTGRSPIRVRPSGACRVPAPE